MVWVLGSAPPPRPLPGPCCSLSLCLKPLKCRHVPPGHSGGNPDPQQVAIPTPSSSPRGRERTPGARWCGRAAQGPVLPLEELRVTTAVTPREKAPQAPGRSPTSAKNSSMKAVLSTAISTSSASSSCVSCSCETQRGPMTTGLRLLRSPTLSSRLRPRPVSPDLLPRLKRSRIPFGRKNRSLVPGLLLGTSRGCRKAQGEGTRWPRGSLGARAPAHAAPHPRGCGTRPRAREGLAGTMHGMPMGCPRGGHREGVLCPAPRGGGRTHSTWAPRAWGT
eukprot:XP_022272374.1 uncharacterized protein LOC111095098 isoform X2 [Canis lupus familiaris]